MYACVLRIVAGFFEGGVRTHQRERVFPRPTPTPRFAIGFFASTTSGLPAAVNKFSPFQDLVL